MKKVTGYVHRLNQRPDKPKSERQEAARGYLNRGATR
jgi:hypothetical protein